MSVPISQFITPHPPATFPPWCPYVCSLHLCLYFCPAHWFICTIFSRFHVYALIYDICFSLSDLLHSVWQSLGPSTSLQTTQFCSLLCLCPFLNWVIYLFIVELQEFLIYSGYNSLIRYMICKYFLPFFGLSFFSLFDGIICSTKVFNFSQVHWENIYLYICLLCAFVVMSKIALLEPSHKFTPMFSLSSF